MTGLILPLTEEPFLIKEVVIHQRYFMLLFSIHHHDTDSELSY